MGTLNKQLKNELTAQFVPLLLARGFSGPSIIEGNATFHEYVRVTALGTQYIDIQFDKNKKPHFVLNIRIESDIGDNIQFSTKFNSKKIISSRVSPRKENLWLRSWYCADQPWCLRLIGYKKSRVVETVSKLIKVIPEIDAWWESPQQSKHIHFVIVHDPLTSNTTLL